MVSSTANAENKIQRSLQKFLNTVIVALISFYQKYLSVLKGFSCAYRILHGSESCSSYIRRMFLEQDMMAAISMSQVRFKECFHASQVLNSEMYKNENSNKTRRRKFLLNMALGFLAPTLFGYSRGECCYNPGACCSAYTENDEDDDN